jgi:hypothetical protein
MKAGLAPESPAGINRNPDMIADQALYVGCDLRPRASDSSVTLVTSLKYGMAAILDFKCIRLRAPAHR